MTFGQVLIAVISDVFDRLQERRESAWVKGQARLTREIELIFGTYPRGKSWPCSFVDPSCCRSLVFVVTLDPPDKPR